MWLAVSRNNEHEAPLISADLLIVVGVLLSTVDPRLGEVIQHWHVHEDQFIQKPKESVKDEGKVKRGGVARIMI